MDVSPLCHKVAYKPWTVVEGQKDSDVLPNAYYCGGYRLYCELEGGGGGITSKLFPQRRLFS